MFKIPPIEATANEEATAYASARWVSERGKNAVGGLFRILLIPLDQALHGV
jgi:hypothetical protein